MGAEPLDSLLEQLGGGDAEAVERVFRDYEPYLRMIVRRRLTPPLRSKFDSMDVVQSVWADVLRGLREDGCRFQDREHLKAYLARSTYNRFIDYYRHHRRALERERSLAEGGPSGSPTSHQPRPSELAQADDLWDSLVKICPPDHRELLDLKRQGLSLAEIAARTGLHPGSVRRILYDLARRISEKERASPAPGREG
jgi:RNA polymerase sigma-70 factor (ECF subfamily)